MTTSGITLTLSARKFTPNVNYNQFDKLQINHKKNGSNQSVFTLQNLQEEVKYLNKQKRKKYLKIAKATLLTSVSIFMLVNPLLASAQVPQAITVGTAPDMIMPADVMKAGLYLIGITLAVAVILAIVLYQISGMYRMLRKSKEATEWESDIIKGFSQVLLAPVIVVTIAGLAYLLFAGLPFFAKPW
jgi:hypothetical protein